MHHLAWLKEQKEETHEPPSSEIGEVEEVVHEEDQNSLPREFEKYEETSHEYEEVSIENTEDNFETHSTLEMKQENLMMDAWTMKEYLLMGAHTSMLVT